MIKVIVVGNGMIGYKFCEKFKVKKEVKNIKLPYLVKNLGVPMIEFT